jgi:hypothetical protein
MPAEMSVPTSGKSSKLRRALAATHRADREVGARVRSSAEPSEFAPFAWPAAEMQRL